MSDENQYNGLSPREQLNLYRFQLKEAVDQQEIKDLREKIEDVEFHILKFGNTWE